MFCRNCGKHNNDNNLFCEECGAPLTPAPEQQPDSKPVKEKKGKGLAKRLLMVNWAGIIGFALAAASVCLFFTAAGETYMYLACTGLLVSILGLSFRRKLRFTFFATIGLLASSFMMSVLMFLIVAFIYCCVDLCGRAFRR